MFFTLIFKISVKKILTEMKIYVNKIKKETMTLMITVGPEEMINKRKT